MPASTSTTVRPFSTSWKTTVILTDVVCCAWVKSASESLDPSPRSLRAGCLEADSLRVGCALRDRPSPVGRVFNPGGREALEMAASGGRHAKRYRGIAEVCSPEETRQLTARKACADSIGACCIDCYHSSAFIDDRSFASVCDWRSPSGPAARAPRAVNQFETASAEGPG